MNKTLFLTIFLAVISIANAQNSQFTKWDKDIKAFAVEDSLNGIPQNVVLFAGSSSFRMWSSVKNDFPQSKVLNRAFGGSRMIDLIYFFNQVVLPYNPSQVVVYEGDNDLSEESKSVDEFNDDLTSFVRLINIHFPQTKITLVSIKPSPSRVKYFDKFKAANEFMREFAQKVKYVDFVDVWSPMLNADGSPNVSLFGKDRLHMNAAGYALWKSILEPKLLKAVSN